MNVQLPFMTQILIGISDLFAGYWWLMVLLLVFSHRPLQTFPIQPTGPPQARSMENERCRFLAR